MRFLLTSDLHRDREKLRWLFENAPPHDAVLVAGDLLDIFSDDGFNAQKEEINRWKDEVLASGKSFAWCSGNHDFFDGDNSLQSAASPLWMNEAGGNECFAADGESRRLQTPSGSFATTTIPWPISGDTVFIDTYRTTYMDIVKDLIRDGKALQSQGMPWFLLNHEPPGDTPLSATYEAPESDFSRTLVEGAEPDFSLHGHVHQAPTSPGGCWIWQIGKTICFNAGQSARGESPHHILLTWCGPGDWTAIWNGRVRAESKQLMQISH